MLPPYHFFWFRFRIWNKLMTEPWLDQALMDSAYRSNYSTRKGSFIWLTILIYHLKSVWSLLWMIGNDIFQHGFLKPFLMRCLSHLSSILTLTRLGGGGSLSALILTLSPWFLLMHYRVRVQDGEKFGPCLTNLK